jgi:hypothetical protein
MGGHKPSGVPPLKRTGRLYVGVASRPFDRAGAFGISSVANRVVFATMR